MSDAKELANKLVEEVKYSAHLFFTPVRAIVNEFSKAIAMLRKAAGEK